MPFYLRSTYAYHQTAACCRFYAAATAGLFMLLSVNAQSYPVDQVRADFKALLKRDAVAPRPSMQSFHNDYMLVEKGFFYAEATEKVPVIICKPFAASQQKHPVVICLHGTGGSKDNAEIKNLLYRFTQEGFMAVAIDGRYHGERVQHIEGHNAYEDAIIRAWQNKDSTRQPHPFYFDTVYDLWKLVDYLITRPDVEASRIGMMGISKGGIETWMAASADARIKVIVPVIATQSFRWSLEHDRWQGRAGTIWAVHQQVARDLGDSAVNKENVAAFWNKILPGITGEFDCPSMIRLLAPRPLLVLNTALDKNCPLPGAELAFEAAKDAYGSLHAMDKLKMDVEPDEPHRFTARHMEMAIAWFKKWL